MGNPQGLLCFLRAGTPTRCFTTDKVPGGNPNPTSALEATAQASQLPEGPTSTLTGLRVGGAEDLTGAPCGARARLKEAPPTAFGGEGVERGQSQPTGSSSWFLFPHFLMPGQGSAKTKLVPWITLSPNTGNHRCSSGRYKLAKVPAPWLAKVGKGPAAASECRCSFSPSSFQTCPLSNQGDLVAPALQSWLPQTRKTSSRAINTPGFSQGSRGWACPSHSRSLFLSTVCLLLSTSLHSEGWQKKRTELSKAHQPGENSEARLQSPSRKRSPEPSESETLSAGTFEEALPPSNEQPNTEACG